MIGLGSEDNGLYKLHINETRLEANDHTQPVITQSLTKQASAYHITSSSSNSLTNNFVIPKSSL